MKLFLKIILAILFVLSLLIAYVYYKEPLLYANASYPVLLLKKGFKYEDRIATFDLSKTFASFMNCEDFKKLHEDKYPKNDELRCVIFNYNKEPMQIVEKKIVNYKTNETYNIKYLAKMEGF